jgi:DNA processing protein
MVLSADHLHRLRLIRTPNVGPVLFRQLLGRYGSAQKALEALPHLNATRKTPLVPPPMGVIEQELATLKRLNARLVFEDMETYPALLRHTPDAPPVLTVRGNPDLLTLRQVGMVGTRAASAAGLRFTHELAMALGSGGWNVTSGMARGIDTAAHTGALAAGGGTIAVLGGGVDHIYPPENKTLYERLCAEGAVVSEYPLGAPASSAHFPRRNRLIAGMSQGIVVLECDRHSGSLITAQYAGDYGREVMAVPGHPSDPRARGPNHLIKQGALLVEGAEDVLTHLNALPLLPQRPARAFVREGEDTLPPPSLPSTEEADTADTFTHLLGATPVELDTLIRQSGLPEAEVTARLTDLELEGRLERLPGNRVRLTG